MNEKISKNIIEKIIGNKNQVQSIQVFKKQNKIIFHLQGVLLSALDIENKQKQLRTLLKIDKVSFYFLSVEVADIFNVISNNWENMKKIIGEIHPAYKEFINNLQLKKEDKQIIFVMDNPVYFHFLKEKNLMGILQEMMLCYYGFDYNFQLILQEEDNNLDMAYSKDQNELNNAKEKLMIQEALSNKANGQSNEKLKSSSGSSIILGKNFNDKPTPMIDVRDDSGSIALEGKIFQFNEKALNDNRFIFKYSITDNTNSITCKHFFKDEASFKEIKNKLSIDMTVRVKGPVSYDKFDKTLVMDPRNVIQLQSENRKDLHEVKRVELHAHTNMSSMDGICTAKKLVSRAKEWNHSAIAITDHGVVQAFPDAFETGRKKGIKIIYGVEGYFVNDGVSIVYNPIKYSLKDTFVVFDIETTGLSSRGDKITEIGAVKIKDGEVIETFSKLVNPEVIIYSQIVKLTGITNELVENEKIIDDILPEFLAFIGDTPLIAHNATFDWGFIKANCDRLNLTLNNTLIDTLQMARCLFPELKKYKLNLLCDHFKISLENHHRASDDAEATGQLFCRLCDTLFEKEIYDVEKINDISVNGDYKKAETHHIIILVKNQIGLKNLYRIISISHLDYFYKRPRILKSVLNQYKEGLIIGSACEAGEIFKGFLNNLDYNTIFNKAKFYDYLEIQPDGNNQFLLRNGTLKNLEELHAINRQIIALADKLKKPVVATGDVHFLDPEDEVYRRILMAGQGFKDSDEQAPLYLKTTEDMLQDFYYLGEEKAREVVITNTNLIADSIDVVIPIPDETSPPKIEGADEQITDMCYKKAHDWYGDILPEIVQARLDKELNSIIKHGFAVMYLIAQKLVTKSMRDGYLVGSRGSVGSSFVATMSDITEVNPLKPHYRCKKCKHSDFDTDHFISSGVDLEDKLCPICGSPLIKDGHDIPFEVFLGFDGDKEPDIDLNFAGEYQPEAHHYTEELFGKSYVFRAGTIGTLADKTAYGYVNGYFKDRDIVVSDAEMNRLVIGCTGIKRTTGQHPGGVMIVPSYKDIYDFTPIQRPADDTNSNTITTHFDYHSISGRLLKLDILGHDVPTIIRMLEDITGFSVMDIELDDKRTMSLFHKAEALNVNLNEIDCVSGTLGIPEFGTRFVRQMLIETNPTTFSELVRISGLSHGTNVWTNNAQNIIKEGKAVLKEVICTRDDIMLYLLEKGVKPKTSFKIMENVRKGKGLTEEYENDMREHSVPEWYIESCKRIEYMFPKAHAVAYVMMSFRIAYYKLNYPEAFYATYFTIKLDDFDADLFTKGRDAVLARWKELMKLGNTAKAKEKNQMTLLEVVYEMYSRNIKLLPVDLYKSTANKFILYNGGILPPLGSLQGLGVNAAQNIVEARTDHVFDTIDDLRECAKLSKTVIELLRNHGCLEGLPENSQISLF